MSNAHSTFAIPKEPTERRAWVIYQLRIKGSSLRKIANRVGVSHQAVSQALLAPSSLIEPEIARELGVPTHVLFPERYDDRGRRIPQTRGAERIRMRERRNVKAAGAA